MKNRRIPATTRRVTVPGREHDRNHRLAFVAGAADRLERHQARTHAPEEGRGLAQGHNFSRAGVPNMQPARFQNQMPRRCINGLASFRIER